MQLRKTPLFKQNSLPILFTIKATKQPNPSEEKMKRRFFIIRHDTAMMYKNAALSPQTLIVFCLSAGATHCQKEQ